jgi:hypothetical protein
MRGMTNVEDWFMGHKDEHVSIPCGGKGLSDDHVLEIKSHPEERGLLEWD